MRLYINSVIFILNTIAQVITTGFSIVSACLNQPKHIQLSVYITFGLISIAIITFLINQYFDYKLKKEKIHDTRTIERANSRIFSK